MTEETRKMIEDVLNTEETIMLIESAGFGAESISQTRAEVKKKSHSNAVEDYKRAKAELARLEVAMSSAQNPADKAQMQAAISAMKAKIMELDAKRTSSFNDQKDAVANVKKESEDPLEGISLKDIADSILRESENVAPAEATLPDQAQQSVKASARSNPETQAAQKSILMLKSNKEALDKREENIKDHTNKQIDQITKSKQIIDDKISRIEAASKPINGSLEMDPSAFETSINEELDEIDEELSYLEEGPLSALIGKIKKSHIDKKSSALKQKQVDLNTQLTKLESELSILGDSHPGKARSLEDKIEFLRSEIDQISQELTDLDSKRISIKETSDPETNLSQMIDEGISFSRKKVEYYKSQIDSLTKRIDEYQAKYDDIGPGHVVARYQLRKRIAEAQAKIDRINDKLSKYDADQSEPSDPSTGAPIGAAAMAEDYEFAPDLRFTHKMSPSPVRLAQEKSIVPFDTKQKELAAKAISNDTNSGLAFSGTSGKVLNYLVGGDDDGDPDTQAKAEQLMSDTTAASMVRALRRAFRNPDADPKEIARLKMKIDMAYRKTVR
jgi:predicted  nucleic acid-binding Zn-ribbon protein